MLKITNRHKVCVVDYFLDGYYLSWKEVNENEFPKIGQFEQLAPKPGVEVNAKVVNIEELSESEYRVFLISCQEYIC